VDKRQVLDYTVVGIVLINNVSVWLSAVIATSTLLHCSQILDQQTTIQPSSSSAVHNTESELKYYK